MDIVFSFFPVILFLTILFLLDNFRLVRVKTLTICIIYGFLSTGACHFLNTLASGWLNLDFNQLSRYFSPVIEETVKALVIFYLVSRKKIGFPVDAAIYGFAVGTGFSLLENIFYLLGANTDFNPLIWIIRGFGTAVMHGGGTSLLAVILIAGLNRSKKIFAAALPGLLIAILLHSGFNHFALGPLFQTLLLMILFPAILMIVFRISNARLQQWLEIEFSSEVELLNMIRMGEFAASKPGRYLLSVKDRFDPGMVVDMYCYLGLYLELSIKAKRNMMLKENGFPVMAEDGMNNKLSELRHLQKRIGKAGEFTLAPFIRMNYRNLWKLNQLKSE